MKLANINGKYGAATVRHAVITFWRSMGVPYKVVMDRTGHRSENLVQFYYDFSKNEYDITAELLQGVSSDEELAEDDVDPSPSPW